MHFVCLEMIIDYLNYPE